MEFKYLEKTNYTVLLATLAYFGSRPLCFYYAMLQSSSILPITLKIMFMRKLAPHFVSNWYVTVSQKFL